MRKFGMVVSATVAMLWSVSATSSNHHGQECMFVADFGITSRALVVQEDAGKIKPETVMEVLNDVYVIISDTEKGRRVFNTILNMARSSSETPIHFAQRLFRNCMESGSADRFLGMSV